MGKKGTSAFQLFAVISVFFTLLLFFGKQAAAQQNGWCIPPFPTPGARPGGPPPPCCGCQRSGKCNGSPVAVATGNYTTSSQDLNILTRGLALTIDRRYNSNRVIDGLMGYGWTSNLT